jgi:hypothetical protein
VLAVKGQRGREWPSITELAEVLQIHHHAAVGLADRASVRAFVRRHELILRLRFRGVFAGERELTRCELGTCSPMAAPFQCRADCEGWHKELALQGRTKKRAPDRSGYNQKEVEA